jgi:hypothetical protein
MRIQDPGWKKVRSGIRDPGCKKFGSRIWDLGWKKLDPGSRMQEKHPGSEKLEISSPNLLGRKEMNNN